MKYYTKSADEVMKLLETNDTDGLSDEKVLTNKNKYGENKLEGKKKKSLVVKFLEQFKDVMIIVLMIAAVVSFIMAFIESKNEGMKVFFEPMLIVAIVILNAILSLYQENKAENALENLKKMTDPKARVIRNGQEQIILGKEVVVGDIIILEAGDLISADARLTKSFNLKVDESSLTGESLPVEKEADDLLDDSTPLGDRKNMIFSGCSIVNGTATAVITTVGMNTEIGKIANLLNESKKNQTPLQIKLATLGRLLGLMAGLICLVIFLVGYLNGLDLMHIFMVSVSLAVSAIPEGLPAIVTIVLSLGVARMAKKNAIIKKLSAVETLGNASVICSDKTGTLTQNKMTLTDAYALENNSNEKIGENNSEAIKKLLTYGTLCSDASLIIENNEIVQEIGDPTEIAIIRGAYTNNIDQEGLDKKYPRLFENPFDSNRKLMSVIVNIDNKKVVIVKGATDILIDRCNQKDKSNVDAILSEYSSKALRVLGIAYKELDNDTDVESIATDSLESGLTFLGLVGMIDPPRTEVKDALNIAKLAGIKTVMITGDHLMTATAIAEDLGIKEENDIAITGAMLDSMDDEEFATKIRNIAVYARVTPENKLRIVNMWKDLGEIVAMTGDGVNDAPALKTADIGCAMGITGTEVSKGAADMILADDNFATIVSATKEGRVIYNNIRKTIAFLLGTNLSEVIIVFVAMILWHESPLISIQLLWINLVTDSLPAIALGMETVDDDVMNRKPRPKNESIFARGVGKLIIIQGLIFAGLAITSFLIGGGASGDLETARTMTFITLALLQVVHALNMRSTKSLFKTGILSNKNLIRAVVISLLLTLLIVFIPPIATVFGLTMLSFTEYAIAISLAFLPIPILELLKLTKIIK